MRYPRPLPFAEALSYDRLKTLFPTSLSSAELEKLRGGILERARFSARVRSAAHLDVLDQGVEQLVRGTSDIATQRLALKQFLKGTGYMASAEERGTLRDFASDARTNLQLRINTQQAQGYGWWKQGQQADLLDAFPAQEFQRVEAREEPRKDWPQRWNAARAATTTEGATDSASGRMVAIKNHPIWVALSRFATPYEPFDFGSGMGVEDVSRDEAVTLGIIGRDTQVPPEDRPFNEGLQASVEVRSARLRQLLEATGVGRFNGAGVFVHTGGSN